MHDFGGWSDDTNGAYTNSTTGDPSHSSCATDHHGTKIYIPHTTTFMGSPIDMLCNGPHPILTPYQFQLQGQPMIEVEAHKFQKATFPVHSL